MKITIENGDKKVTREVNCCRDCPCLAEDSYCNLFDEDITSDCYKQCDQCKKELGELE